MQSRNSPHGFAARTRKNLEYVEAASGHADIHVVTQSANSLLGLIVFPWEKIMKKDPTGAIPSTALAALVNQGWPDWDICLGECNTLGDLVRHLRNAVAHGKMQFSSDSLDPKLVTITVEDFKPKKKRPYWRAKIGAPKLKDFCLRFIDLLETSGTQI